ncbi:Lcl C-terminal domain-containing protein [Ideonella livida]|uniref:DUF1566 domain-containing protein n=1 Tax=Ideonella livida TaxID=2707176 RepID=A0A7C9PF68_9BURK|nr:DUF1566 domain-containing protein [Ideonella livida]NDY90071.1 DUF1566 domain-containing protein [Ideonella livida]
MINSFAPLGSQANSAPARQAADLRQGKQWAASLAAMLLPLVMGAVPATSQAQVRYTVSPDGTEIADSLTRLAWRRCAEGQQWDGGTCTGTAAKFNHEQALAHAGTQTGWRLPNVKELASLVDHNRSVPAINTAIFPATPSLWFWSSSPRVGYPDAVWGVNFSDGIVFEVGRDYSSGHVRLVRAESGR